MNRSLTVSWSDPAALAAAGGAMAGIDSLRAIRDGARPAGGGYTTLEAKANVVRAITEQTGRLRAICKLVHLGRRVATAQGRLEDAAGKLCAHASATCLVLGTGN